MAQALLGNDREPAGVAAVTLPIPDKEYSKAINDLRELGIGDVRARDCYVDQIMDAPPVLDCLEGQTVNIDELDFLMRSLDRFTDDELAKFQAMAAKLELTDIKDLINLSFCSEKATVIADFGDLETVGRRHYMTMQGGACSTEEHNSLNGVGIARGLISSGEGTMTPYGLWKRYAIRRHLHGYEKQLYNERRASVPVPKDLTVGKTKVKFNLTKRQLVCFGFGASLGVPLFFLCKGFMGTSAAAIVLVVVMLPFMARKEKAFRQLQNGNNGIELQYTKSCVLCP